MSVSRECDSQQVAKNHSKPRRHPKAKTTAQFLHEATERHGSKFDYSAVVYRNAKTHILIRCPLHGSFEQMPEVHLNGSGCPKCRYLKAARSRTTPFAEMLRRFRNVHGDRYDYRLADYVNQSEKITILCPQHGPFRQRPYSHTSGRGCPRCRNVKNAATQRLSLAAILLRFHRAHGNRYDYRHVCEVANADHKVCIVCREHGPFLQRVAGHASGKGCPACCESHGERRVARALQHLKLPFERQKRFSSCRDRKPLPFDFYVPSARTLIEYDGSQHHVESPRFDLPTIRHHDRIKTTWAEKHGFPLIRMPFDCFEAIPDILRATLAPSLTTVAI